MTLLSNVRGSLVKWLPALLNRNIWHNFSLTPHAFRCFVFVWNYGHWLLLLLLLLLLLICILNIYEIDIVVIQDDAPLLKIVKLSIIWLNRKFTRTPCVCSNKQLRSSYYYLFYLFIYGFFLVRGGVKPIRALFVNDSSCCVSFLNYYTDWGESLVQ